MKSNKTYFRIRKSIRIFSINTYFLRIQGHPTTLTFDKNLFGTYSASRSPSIFLKKSTYLGRSKGGSALRVFGTKMSCNFRISNTQASDFRTVVWIDFPDLSKMSQEHQVFSSLLSLTRVCLYSENGPNAWRNASLHFLKKAGAALVRTITSRDYVW